MSNPKAAFMFVVRLLVVLLWALFSHIFYKCPYNILKC